MALSMTCGQALPCCARFADQLQAALLRVCMVAIGANLAIADKDNIEAVAALQWPAPQSRPLNIGVCVS